MHGNPVQYVTIYTNSPEACVSIGDGAVLCAARISSKFEVTIGDNVLIEESGIMDTDFHTITPDRREPTETAEECRVRLGRGVSIGARSIVCKGVTIGDNALVFPGSIVNKSVPAGSIVAGNPIKPVRKHDPSSKPETPRPTIAQGAAVCVAAAAIASALACGGRNQEARTMEARPTTAQHWAALKGKRVAFGHQSIGSNILSGIRTLAASAAIDVRVTESRDLSAGGNIVHFTIGENGDPASKMKDFAATLRSAGTKDVDIAMMKLCYLDFDGGTDAGKVATEYIETLDQLAGEFPRVRFVAFTAPLTVRQTGPKAWAKRLLGRMPAGYAENVRRLQFNERLRARYGPERRLFDLARVEAEGLGRYDYAGQAFEALNPAITTDGGHLNGQGEQRVAAALIELLAGLPLAR